MFGAQFAGYIQKERGKIETRQEKKRTRGELVLEGGSASRGMAVSNSKSGSGGEGVAIEAVGAGNGAGQGGSFWA